MTNVVGAEMHSVGLVMGLNAGLNIGLNAGNKNYLICWEQNYPSSRQLNDCNR